MIKGLIQRLHKKSEPNNNIPHKSSQPVKYFLHNFLIQSPSDVSLLLRNLTEPNHLPRISAIPSALLTKSDQMKLQLLSCSAARALLFLFKQTARWPSLMPLLPPDSAGFTIRLGDLGLPRLSQSKKGPR